MNQCLSNHRRDTDGYTMQTLWERRIRLFISVERATAFAMYIVRASAQERNVQTSDD